MEKRHIAILGSTGSIGTQALDVIRQHPDLFEVELLTANNSSELLINQAIEFNANNVVICNEEKYEEVNQALRPHFVKVFAGMQSACDLVTSEDIDIVLTSMVGFSGLASTVAAIKAGKTIALANKETLVAAGQTVMEMAMEYKAKILPVDSEHSAIFQYALEVVDLRFVLGYVRGVEETCRRHLLRVAYHDECFAASNGANALARRHLRRFVEDYEVELIAVQVEELSHRHGAHEHTWA